jgi:two-component SAPR family response regulator
MLYRDKTSKLLKIQTLGELDIIMDKKSLIEVFDKSNKLMELFKYFLTYRGKKLTPESIIENLQPENDFQDSKSVLRSQIFRLRKILKSITADEDSGDYINIVFRSGYYILELGKNCFLDIDKFEELLSSANKTMEKDPDEIASLYRSAIGLYKGKYLSEDSYSSSSYSWVVPVRNYYNRLYLQAFLKLAEILKEKGDYAQLAEICEEAIIIEPYEEVLHIYFLEALLKQRQIMQAISHYGYITSSLYKELNISPSPSMKDIYRKIRGYNTEKGETNLQKIELKFDDEIKDGALLCDRDHFKLLYNSSKRKSLREKNSDCLCLVTFYNGSASTGYDRGKGKEIMKALCDVMCSCLRKGDALALWNDSQIIAIIFGMQKESTNVVEKRIRSSFANVCDNTLYKLSFQFKQIAP